MGNGVVRCLARFFVVYTLLTLFGEASAWAESPTLVLIVEGGGGNKLRTAIAAELPEPWTRADVKAVASAAKKRELSEGVNALESPTTKGPYVRRLGQVATDVGAKAAVAVHVTKGNKRQAHLVLVTAAGSTRVDTQVTLAAPADDAALIVKAFTGELAALAPPDEPTPKQASKPEPTPSPAPADPSPEAPKPLASTQRDAPGPTPPAKTGGSEEPPPMLVGTVAMELADRYLRYRDVVTELYSDESGIAPTPSIAVDAFPGARTGTPVLQDVGVFGDFKYGIVQAKSLDAGKEASVTWSRFDVGIKYRLLLFKREWRAPMIAPSVSYGQETYIFKNPTPPSPQALDTPSVAYKMVRPRVDARAPIGPIAVLAGAGFLWVVSSGEVAKEFRDATVLGWEADLGLTVPIGRMFEVFGGIAYRRYIYWFSPVAGDANIANGAHDQIRRLGLGVSAHL